MAHAKKVSFLFKTNYGPQGNPSSLFLLPSWILIILLLGFKKVKKAMTRVLLIYIIFIFIIVYIKGCDYSN